MKHYDYLIVGAGLWGATFAYLAKQKGRRCLVIDRREAPGGNVRCEAREGINVHLYGAHIFHTSDEEVWRFANSLVPFNRYTNQPVARIGDELYNLPFNMNTFAQMWHVRTPAEAKAVIDEQRSEALRSIEGEPRNLEEQALALVGRDIYEKLIKGYTQKQWGRPCTELPAFIIRRLPVRLTFDNNYFNDSHQGIPIGGYNRLTEALLEGTEVRCGVDYFAQRAELDTLAERIVYTGQIDELFDFRLGHLAWRTVRFEHETLHEANHQGNAVVNYTSAEVPFTRIIEHKHFEAFGDDVYRNPLTVVSREYSSEWGPGAEPYYPINDERNQRLAEAYAELARGQRNLIVGGRLGTYRYLDMAPVIAQVLELFQKEKV